MVDWGLEWSLDRGRHLLLAHVFGAAALTASLNWEGAQGQLMITEAHLPPQP